MENLLHRSDIEVIAICDVDSRMLQMSKELIQKSGKPVPAVFTGHNYAYRKLLEVKNLNGIVIATPRDR